MAASSTWILSLKFLSICTAFLSIAMAMKFSIPLIIDFTLNEIPSIWSTILHLLKPPFLYVVVNGIIITIALSAFLLEKRDEDEHQSEPLIQPNTFASDFEPEIVVLDSPAAYECEPRVSEVNSVPINTVEVVPIVDEDDFTISRSTWTPPRNLTSLEEQKENQSPVNERPLVSSRIGHRKPAKSSPEGGRVLGVAKPKKHETLENTWKTITDGRHVPLTRHLRKSDTWDNRNRQICADQCSPQKMIKSETFKGRTNYEANSPSVGSSPGSGKLRKEGSVSQDELNRRVEAFIKKFNDEMRLQRQESLKQYKRMVTHAR